MSDNPQLDAGLQNEKPKTTDELLPLVYDELRKLAAHKRANEAPGQTLQPTVLVHEAYLRLIGSENPHWNSRNHFNEEAAQVLSLSEPTVKRYWVYSRAWLVQEFERLQQEK